MLAVCARIGPELGQTASLQTGTRGVLTIPARSVEETQPCPCGAFFLHRASIGYCRRVGTLKERQQSWHRESFLDRYSRAPFGFCGTWRSPRPATSCPSRILGSTIPPISLPKSAPGAGRDRNPSRTCRRSGDAGPLAAQVRVSGMNFCYHFATQLAGTRQNTLVRQRGCEPQLCPKTLTEWHAIEPAGMDKTELGNRSSIQLSYGTKKRISA